MIVTCNIKGMVVHGGWV